MITAVIGAGGKTTLIHELSKKYLSEGKKVFVTTTTHMFIEEDTVLSDDPEEIKKVLLEKNYVMAGQKFGEKISPLSPSTYLSVCKDADEVLVEADGSKHLPVKFPKDTEPVIPENVDKIILVTGLHALNKKASDVIFRFDLAKEILGISEDTVVTPEIMQKLLQKGYLEKLMNEYKDKKIEIKVTNANTLYERAVASMLSSNLDVSILKKEWFEEKPCLFICGAGHVAKDLADLASHLDFRIIVMDSRKEFSCSERFPYAEKVICDSFENINSYLVPNAYYAVMTPGHLDDYTCVRAILGSDYNYLGMIGSRKKKAATFEKLMSEGFTEEKVNEIHAPIGLPIGGNTPGEIAVSVLAEIIQVKNQDFSASVSSELLNTEKSGVLCIITGKTGSSPRGVGSMMLVTEDGTMDTIGGGMVEFAAINDAKNIKTAEEKNYILDSVEGAKLGMICGGTNTVLFLPI